MSREHSANALKADLAAAESVVFGRETQKKREPGQRRSGTQVWNLLHALAMRRAAGPMLGERDMERLKEVIAVLDPATAEKLLSSILRRAMDDGLDVVLLRQVLDSVKPGDLGIDLKLDFLHDRRHAVTREAPPAREAEEGSQVFSMAAQMEWPSTETLSQFPSPAARKWRSRLRRLRRVPTHVRSGLDFKSLFNRSAYAYLSDREIENLRSRFCRGLSGSISAPQVLAIAAAELKRELDDGGRFGGVARMYARIDNHLMALVDAPPPSYFVEINASIQKLAAVGYRGEALSGEENLAKLRAKILELESFGADLKRRDFEVGKRVCRLLAHLKCRFYGVSAVDHCVRKSNYSLGLERYRREELLGTARCVGRHVLRADAPVLVIGALDDPTPAEDLPAGRCYLGFNRGQNIDIARHQVSFNLSTDGSLLVLNEGRGSCIDVCAGERRVLAERRVSNSIFGVRIGRDGELVAACRSAQPMEASQVGVLPGDAAASLQVDAGEPACGLEVTVYLPLRAGQQPVMVIADAFAVRGHTEWRVSIYSAVDDGPARPAMRTALTQPGPAQG